MNVQSLNNDAVVFTNWSLHVVVTCNLTVVIMTGP